jgi:membrane protease YdiL (CAAX protease family)
VAYVWACGRKLRDIGFHRHGLGHSILISAVCLGGLYALGYAVQLLALVASGEEARLALSAIDPITGMAGGPLFALWLFAGNLVNSAMEEGLFRGAMLRHFRVRHSVWKAILLQALLFAIWHMNWPAKHLLTGEASLGEVGMEAFSLLLSTSLAGVLLGYMYHKTDNLWSAYVAHTINNSVLNMVFIRTAEGLQPGYELALFLAIWLPGYLVLLPVIGWWAKRLKMPEVRPWGDFEAVPTP